MNFKICVARSKPNAFKTSSEYAYNFSMIKIRFHCGYDSNLVLLVLRWNISMIRRSQKIHLLILPFFILSQQNQFLFLT